MENPLVKHKRSRDKAKRLAFALFGNKCVVCGFDDPRALQIDHKMRPLGTTVKRDRATYKTGYRLYLGLVSGREDLSQYQLLCANHNWIKRFENNEFTSKTKNLQPQAVSNKIVISQG